MVIGVMILDVDRQTLIIDVELEEGNHHRPTSQYPLRLTNHPSTVPIDQNTALKPPGHRTYLYQTDLPASRYNQKYAEGNLSGSYHD